MRPHRSARVWKRKRALLSPCRRFLRSSCAADGAELKRRSSGSWKHQKKEKETKKKKKKGKSGGQRCGRTRRERGNPCREICCSVDSPGSRCCSEPTRASCFAERTFTHGLLPAGPHEGRRLGGKKGGKVERGRGCVTDEGSLKVQWLLLSNAGRS